MDAPQVKGMNAEETSDWLFEMLKCSVGACAASNRRAKNGVGSAFAGITPVERQLSGLGFFPGGDGLWKEPYSTSPVVQSTRTIMVVGSTFGCESDFEKLLTKRPVPEENCNTGTWGSLPTPLVLHKNGCFFTNAYPGLLKGAKNIDSELRPAELDSTYMSQSREFCCLQVTAIKPRLILFLGKLPEFVLGEERLTKIGWRPFLSPKWGELSGFRSVDKANKAFIKESSWHGVEHGVGFAILLHRCNRRRNLDKRGLSYPGPDSESSFLEQIIEETHSGMPTMQTTQTLKPM